MKHTFFMAIPSVRCLVTNHPRTLRTGREISTIPALLVDEMNRYLLHISYIGTNFRGIQKTVNKLEEPRLDTFTVQGCLELALRVFRPVNEIETVLSSRTDAGVHALHSTVHVDLERNDGSLYDPTILTGVLNRSLDKQRLPIRVLGTQIVPNTFHCRYNAIGRTYLYRIAVAKNGEVDSHRLKNRNYEAFIPVEEIDRCFFLQNPNFEINRLRAASQMFLGRHDFRTFMSVSRQKSVTRNHPMFTLRKIDEINILPGKSLALGDNAALAESTYNYWDIEIKAKSFLYKQVRRVVGSLLAVATNRIDERCIQEMLTIPSKNSWNPQILLSPACGLYLRKIHYNLKDMEFHDKNKVNQ